MNIPISKFVIKDRHGNIRKSDSFTTVAQVLVSADDGVGEPSADSSYEEGVLCINLHNIKGDGIKQITFKESQEDGGTNYIHVKMTSDSGEPSYTFPIKNGSRGNGIRFIEVEESQEDGGDNIVHIHCTDDEEVEGTELRIKNGSRGNGIASVTEQTSSEDGGINTHTFTDTDGQTHVIHTKNGRTGRPGVDRQPVESGDVMISQVSGYSESLVMSQKGVTEEIGDDSDKVLSVAKRFINENGTLGTANGFIGTDFIPVVQGQKIYYKGEVGSKPCIVGYSTNSATTSTYQGVLLDYGSYASWTEVTIPAGVNYIVAVSKDSVTYGIIAKHGIKKRLQDVENISASSEAKVTVLEDYIGDDTARAFSVEGYMISENGANMTFSGCSRTNFIAVVPRQKVTYMGDLGSQYPAIAGYSSAAFASYEGAVLQGGTYTTKKTVTIPEGVNYIIAVTKNNATSKLIDTSTGLKRWAKEKDEEIAILREMCNPYYGKTVNWIGDSIVQDYDFDEIVADYFGMTLNDYGINGSTIASDANDTRNSIALRYTNMSDDADVVVVSAGTNDWQYAHTPVGTMADRTASTFYGALHVLCQGLMAKYSTKLVFFTTPIKRNQQNASAAYTLDTDNNPTREGYKLSQYADIIKEVCAYYSIPVCDLWREGYLNPNMTAQAEYFDNIGTHPNNTGRVIMARRVRGFMKQLM